MGVAGVESEEEDRDERLGVVGAGEREVEDDDVVGEEQAEVVVREEEVVGDREWVWASRVFTVSGGITAGGGEAPVRVRGGTFWGVGFWKPPCARDQRHTASCTHGIVL